MGYLRSISHPDVETREFDLSNVASTQGGTTSLVIGFAKQGESVQPVQPTSKASFKTYFGAPETEAERYFYYAGAEVFDKGGSLIAARIPYNNNAQNLTPAVTYKIEEWQLSTETDYKDEDGNPLTAYVETTATTADCVKWCYLENENEIGIKEIETYTATDKDNKWVLDYYYDSDSKQQFETSDGESSFVEIRIPTAFEKEIVPGDPTKLTSANLAAGKFSFITCSANPLTAIVTYDIGSVVPAAVSADVTNDTKVLSGKLAIPALGDKVWEEEQDEYPYFDYQTKFGMSTKMKVLTKIGDDTTTVAKLSGDGVFYQCVTELKDVETIAKKGNQSYKWIEWREKPDPSKTEKAMVAAVLGCKEDDVPSQISGVRNVTTIVPMDDADDYGWIALSSYQSMRDGTETAPENQIIIANITEEGFAADRFNNDGEEILGIVPVLIGGAQALPKQSRITLPDNVTNAHVFNAVETLARGKSMVGMPDEVVIKKKEFNSNSYAKDLGGIEEYSPFGSTYSNDLINKVPTINLNSSYKPNGDQMNYVTLVVCKLAVSEADDNKIVMTILESFTGSLDRECKDASGNSVFIDDIVNSEESGSTYVKMFSNYKTKMVEKTVRENLSHKTAIPQPTADNTMVITVPKSIATKNSDGQWWRNKKQSLSIGFTKEQTKKYINYGTLTASLESIFDTLSNVDELDIDIVVDAGLTTIANRLKKLTDSDETGFGKYEYDTFFDEIKSVDDIGAWKSICAKFLTFCSSTRKDCMALLDAPRSLCVKDNAKLVRPNSRPQYSIDFDILPKFNYLAGLNSSYGAGYCTWMSYVDDFSGKTVWLPPSIAAEGSLLLTDNTYNYWDAPAGVKRGTVTAATDVSFNPNPAQQDSIYSKSWNYSKRTNTEGVLIWGQKTLLTTNSAFSRINVRRLFLRLERMTRKFLKDYIFEINSLKNRNRIIDGLTPIYENVKTMGGLYDYQLVCSSELNNSATVIDNNELRFAALLKPARVAEFICTSFFALATGMDFTEAYSEL